MSSDTEKFYTLKGYLINESMPLTYAMEDYLEMIYRIYKSENEIRVKTVAEKLNVKPSSATKMLQHLKGEGLVDFKKYGVIFLSEKGKSAGEYLMYRHKTVNEFLKALNKTENETEQTEKIEHYLSVQTVDNLSRITEKIKAGI